MQHRLLHRNVQEQDPALAEDKRFVFFCAGGMRSALSAATAQDVGLRPVAHIEGGFGAWREAGGPVEKVEARASSHENIAQS
jgi:rhodanese-related sulfurtransferase